MSGLSAKNLKLDQNLPFWFISSTHLDLYDHVKVLWCLKGEGVGWWSFYHGLSLYVILRQVIANWWERRSIEINFYMGINDEKGKKSWRLHRIEDFISYLSSTSSILSKRIHWVSWCSANHQKSILPPKTPVKPNISAPLARFQRLCPNMSSPQARHVRPLSFFPS
jgi:hypothetical protein